jgi:antitoxin VapB
MAYQRHVKIFRNGRNQAVRIPREFALPGDDAVMWQEEGRLVIAPVPPRGLLAVLASLSPLAETFPEIFDAPAEPIEL